MTALIQAILLGILEGVTEFLPISSTGHLRLCQQWMGISAGNQFWETFAIFIQVGAIMAVVVYFRRRLIELVFGPRARTRARARVQMAAVGGPGGETAVPVEVEVDSADPVDAATEPIQFDPATRRRILLLIGLATLPALAIGYLTHDWITANLETSTVIAAALLVGGLGMLLAEWIRPASQTDRLDQVTWKQALGVGCAQVLAVLFPGTSRSAATIIGGMFTGMDRRLAAEFSFILAIPVMFAACGYALLKFFLERPQVSRQEILLLTIGTLVAYLVAWGVIGWFMSYIRRYTFVPFAIYRIALAILVFLLAP